MSFTDLENLLPDEEILMEGFANWNTTLNSKGGKLFLTNKRIIFKAHLINFGKKYFECYLDEIYVEKNTITIFVVSNLVSFTISFRTKNGEEHSFVVTRGDKDLWVSKISEAVLNTVQSNLSVPSELSETEKQEIKSNVGVVCCGGCGAFVVSVADQPTKCNYCGRLI